MSLEYVNRRGEKYYLLQGKTKTGKPKYYASRKPEGVPVAQMPEGYEFYESPERGIVSVRKIRPTNVRAEERDRLAALTRELAGIAYFRVEVEDDSLVVYTPATAPEHSFAALSEIFGPAVAKAADAMSWIGQRGTYAAMLRFTLYDEEKRLFGVERWCFRGSIDDWFFLASAKPLEVQARKYLPHLNKESFYDLM